MLAWPFSGKEFAEADSAIAIEAMHANVRKIAQH
jgi:hypothetical protein